MPHDPAVVSAQPLAPARAHVRPPSRFAHHSSVLQALAGDVLQYAKMLGASDCEVEVSEGFGQAVTVRCGDVENIEYNRDKGIGVTVYLGARKGYASSSDFRSESWRSTWEA